MSARFFTSDSHFDHQFLACDIRGFPSIEDHDEELIRKWNLTVRPDDTVFHLGDFSLKKPPAINHYVDKLNGTIHLIWGNHDAGFGGNRNSNKYVKTYIDAGFESVQSFIRLKVEGIQVMLSHFPYEGDHSDDDRCNQYRLRDEGLPILHGHTHSAEYLSNTDSDTLQIHVGLDAWELNPVHQDTIRELLKAYA